MKCIKRVICLIFALAAVTSSIAESGVRQLAFPTAEGYGKYALGGRGGRVIHVTNLNDSGTGSFRAAIAESGPRTIVFDVSGTIKLESNITIRNPYVTIAGQTAPGDGICLRGGKLSIGADHVIVRHIRIRLGDDLEGDNDALECRGRKNVIIDHVSASWSVDETMSVYGCDSVTVQWCMITESMFFSHHVKGSHGFGGIWGSNLSTYHHNLLAHHSSRNPRIASNTGYMDYRNNVVYNWGYNSCYGGEFHDPYNPAETDCSYINMVNNYYKPGPATQPGKVSWRIVNPSYRNDYGDYGKWYVSGNYMEGNSEVTADNWNGGVQAEGSASYMKMAQPWEAMPISEQTAIEAYELVLAQAGATCPKRDAVDMRICSETRGGYATYEGVEYKKVKNVTDATQPCGIIDSQADVGGWPELSTSTPPVDSDGDGMPDEWETRHTLNPNDPSDRNLTHSSGYTALEVYLNELCGETVKGEFVKPHAEGKEASVYWRLESDDSAEVTGDVEVIEEQMQGLVLDRYTAPNKNAVWPEHTGWDSTRKTQRIGIQGGEWPGEANYNSDRYVQFGVRALASTTLFLEKVSLFLCGCGTNGMQCHVFYDTDAVFSHPVLMGDYSAKGTMPNSNMQEVVATPYVSIAPGGAFYLRIYPWSRGAMSNKTICISDVMFRGKTSDANTVIAPCHTTHDRWSAYSLGGVHRPYSLRGINIIRKSGGQIVKVTKM